MKNSQCKMQKSGSDSHATGDVFAMDIRKALHYYLGEITGEDRTFFSRLPEIQTF